jgi:DNA polymerase III alpha subunit
MQFLTLEDRYGLMEAVMFPDVFKRYGDHGGRRTILARGTVQSRLQAKRILLFRIWNLWPEKRRDKVPPLG